MSSTHSVTGRTGMAWIIALLAGLVLECSDGVGSEKKIDQCGLCGGDDSTCKIVSGLYTRPTLPVGYNLIAKIPPGACNINITELRHSRNYLALRTQSGKYTINGNWAINWSGTYEASGTRFIYRRHDAHSDLGEQILAKGPTSETVDVLVIYQQPNPGIKYEYSLPVKPNLSHNVGTHLPVIPVGFNTSRSRGGGPKKDGQRKHRHNGRNHGRNYQKTSTIDKGESVTKNPGQRGNRRLREYRWRIMGFSECDATCGGGMQKTIVVCVKRKSFSVVDESKCKGIMKPAAQTIRCNTSPCPTRWVSDAWSPCSSTCGEGVQTRSVSCKQDLSPRMQIQAADGACYGLEKPSTSQPCNLTPCSRWKTGNWSQCSVECGRGIVRREVKCVSSSGESLPDSECGTEKPEEEKVCNMGLCSKTWLFTHWSRNCSAECGTGVYTRSVTCSYRNATDKVHCDKNSRPPTEKPCSSTRGCGAKWFIGPWSECSARCGKGFQVREVVCLSYTEKQWRGNSDSECRDKEKPSTQKPCSLSECPPLWFMSEWSPCSKSCGTGVQTREVMCTEQDEGEDESCAPEEKPTTRQACNTQNCPVMNEDPECVDKYRNCQLVLRSRLCSYPYYRQLCCDSCSDVT